MPAEWHTLTFYMLMPHGDATIGTKKNFLFSHEIFCDIYFCRLVSVNINDIILSKLDNFFSAFSALPLCCLLSFFFFISSGRRFFFAFLLSCHFMRCALLALPLYLYLLQQYLCMEHTILHIFYDRKGILKRWKRAAQHHI